MFLYTNFKKRRNEKRVKKFYDKFFYLVVVIAPISNLPQVYRIWVGKDASGVSSLAWFLFSVISLTWLFYGILHRDKHILVMNGFLMIIQAFIAIGAIVYS